MGPRHRHEVAAVLVVAFASLLAPGATAMVAAVPAPLGSSVATSSGVGAGIFAVAGTADYAFELTTSGRYYVIEVPDPSASMNATLMQNDTTIFQGSAFLTLASESPLAPGTYDLHLAGHGQAAVALDFTSPGTYQLPLGERVIVVLAAMANNRITIATFGDSGTALHLQVYDDRMVRDVNTSVALGTSVTFDLPWSDANAVTMILETPSGTGTYGVAWSAVQAPGLENSFLLPLPLAAIVALVVLAAVGLALYLRFWHQAVRPPPPPR